MPFQKLPVTGVTNFYGPRTTDGSFGGLLITDGSIREEVIRVRFNVVPDGASAKSPVIPALATIREAHFKCRTAFVGGTSYTMGTYDATTGAAISATGIFTAANLAQASMTAGANIVGSGAIIGTSVGAAPVRIGMVIAGTFTAGYGEAIIRYVPAPPVPVA